MKTGSVQTSWVTTTPVDDVDISSFSDGLIHALDLDKLDTGLVFNSPYDAAWQLDGKSEDKYIKRYINVERPHPKEHSFLCRILISKR